MKDFFFTDANVHFVSFSELSCLRKLTYYRFSKVIRTGDLETAISLKTERCTSYTYKWEKKTKLRSAVN